MALTDWQYRVLIFLVADAQGSVITERLAGNVEWEPDPAHRASAVGVLRQRSEWCRVHKLSRKIAELVPGRDLEEVLQELNMALRAERQWAFNEQHGYPQDDES